MPYKSSKIKIEGTEFDRRIKLTAEDKELIKWLRDEEEISYQKLANQFNVSKRTIIFICKPESLEASKKARALRGGSKIYYRKEKHSETIKEHRRYKQDLKLKEFQLKRAIKTDQIPMAERLGYIVGKPLMQSISGAGAGIGIYDAIERYKAGDRSGAVLSALQGIGGALTMIPTLPTRIGGALLEAGAGALDYFRDQPEQQQ